MKRLVFILLLILSSIELKAQTFAYSFSGSLEQPELEKFKSSITELPTILSLDLKIKSDSNKGEIIFSIQNMDNQGENDLNFSPVDIKAILLKFGLEPLEFRQLK